MKIQIRGATAVSLGILGSRVVGFIRESVFAHYFGNSDAADAFRAALRIPNLLQNLFGEGVLSASFIPVYSKLRSEKGNAAELARSIFAILFCLSSVITILGLIFTPQLIDLITPGFEGEKRELAIQLVRILFPSTALLVFSAWCLGIQNSHRKFLLSYSAPILWNGAIIAALFLFGRNEGGIVWVTWGVALGSLLQFAIQLPMTMGLLGQAFGSIHFKTTEVKQVLHNFVPVVITRGVVQISAFIDSMIASLLSSGSLAVLSYAQILYLLPVSLFGMSVSAAELPELSEMSADDKDAFKNRLERGLERILFFIFPSAASFIFIGDRLIAFVFQSGAFGSQDTARVWSALGILAIGMPFSTASRLLSSYFYSRSQARTLLPISLMRVVVSTALACFFSLVLNLDLGGLCIGAALASVLETALLVLKLKKELGILPKISVSTLSLGVIAILSGLASRWISEGYPRIEAGLIAVISFGAIYLFFGLAIRKMLMAMKSAFA